MADPGPSLPTKNNNDEAVVAENDWRERDEGVGGISSSKLEGGQPVPQQTSTADAAEMTGGEDNNDGIVKDGDGQNDDNGVVKEVEGGNNAGTVSTGGWGGIPMTSPSNNEDDDKEDTLLRQAGTTTMTTATPSSPLRVLAAPPPSYPSLYPQRQQRQQQL